MSEYSRTPLLRLLLFLIVLGQSAALAVGGLTSVATGSSLVQQGLLRHLIDYYRKDVESDQILPFLRDFAANSALVATEPLKAFLQDTILTLGVAALGVAAFAIVLKKVHTFCCSWLSEREQKAVADTNEENYSFMVAVALSLLLLQAGSMVVALLLAMMASPWAETVRFYNDFREEFATAAHGSLVAASSLVALFGYAAVHDRIKECQTGRCRLLISMNIALITIIAYMFILPEASRRVSERMDNGVVAIVEAVSPRLFVLKDEFGKTLAERFPSAKRLSDRWMGPLTDLSTWLTYKRSGSAELTSGFAIDSLRTAAALYLLSLAVFPLILDKVETKERLNQFDSLAILVGASPVFFIPNSSVFGRILGLVALVAVPLVYMPFRQYICETLNACRRWKASWNLWVSLAAAIAFAVSVGGLGLAILVSVVVGCGYAWYRFGFSHSFLMGLFVSGFVWAFMSILVASTIVAGSPVFLE